MKLTELKPILERDPFRPFGLRLFNGVKYEFVERRDLGIPRKVTDTLFYFGEAGWALIDIENIVEVFQKQ
jgi:hypothetical protein